MSEKIPAVGHISDLTQWYPEFALPEKKRTKSEAAANRWQREGANYKRIADMTDEERQHFVAKSAIVCFPRTESDTPVEELLAYFDEQAAKRLERDGRHE